MWRSSAVAAITEVPPLTWGTYKGRRQYVYRMIYVKTAAPELENLDIQRELERLVNIKNIKNAKIPLIRERFAMHHASVHFNHASGLFNNRPFLKEKFDLVALLASASGRRLGLVGGISRPAGCNSR